MPINKNKSHSEIVKEIMDSFDRTGKIGSSFPKNRKEALSQANAIAYQSKKESKTMIDKINDLLEYVMTSTQPMVMDRSQVDILDTYGKDAPHYILDKIKDQLMHRGIAVDVEEDKNNFLLTLHKDDAIIKKKVSKEKIVDGEVGVDELLS